MNDSNLKPFKKNDPRINRKGRPKSFDALRELGQQIAHEVALKNGEPIVIEGHVATVSEMILRQWAQSKDPRLQMAFIEIAFGKAPVRNELTGANGGKIEQEVTLKDESIIRKLLPEIIAGGAQGAAGETE